jgi:hypothetical protein
MKNRKQTVAWWTVVSLTLAGLALARLGEVLLKRELHDRAESMGQEISYWQNACQDSVNHHAALLVDLAAARAQAKMPPQETYLDLHKSTGAGSIMMGNKVVYQFRFRVKGNMPVRIKGQVPELPEGVLPLQGKEDHTVWYRPDYLYEQAGQTVPQDSAQRRVDDAFGRYAIMLGGAVAIHGPLADGVPPEAVDHIYVELNSKDLLAVYNALDVGSRVLIRH